MATRALIFDMDGVLIDSEPLHLLAYQELFSKWGKDFTEEDNREFLGRKDIEIADVLIERMQLRNLTAQSLVDQKEAILKRLLHEEGKPQPGVLQVLNKAKELELPLAIASSATLGTIHLIVSILDIKEYFRTLTSGDEVPLGKPQPDVYLLAAQRLETEPAQCLVIEDTYNGIKAAKAAGMLCVAVPCQATRHQNHQEADAILESLEHLDVEGWYHSGLLASCR